MKKIVNLDDGGMTVEVALQKAWHFDGLWHGIFTNLEVFHGVPTSSIYQKTKSLIGGREGGGAKILENIVIFYIPKLNDAWDVNYKQVAKLYINKNIIK